MKKIILSLLLILFIISISFCNPPSKLVSHMFKIAHENSKLGCKRNKSYKNNKICKVRKQKTYKHKF